jgi:hypothetical protein
MSDAALNDAFMAWYEVRLMRPPVAAASRVGSPITTLSGGAWWPHDPHPADVREADFPALALVMRWGGQMRYASTHPRAGRLAPYSVGQHSCLVYELVTELGGSVVERALALYHDLQETKPPGDVQRPVLDGHCAVSAGEVVSLDGGRGVFVESLGAVILNLLSDPKKQELLRKRGLTRAKEFGWRSAAEHTLKFITTG